MSRTLRAGAGAALVAVLLLAGCQGEEPGPIPTAKLPTPNSSTPSPSKSEDATQQDIDAAVDVYSEGRRVAEQMLVEGAYGDVTEQLSPYFTGSYLNFWEAEFNEFREKRWTTDGTVHLEIISATDYETTSDATQLSLLICSDYSAVTTTDSDGKRIRRGFDYSYDEIVMRKTSDRSWRAESGGSEALSKLSGSACEEAMT